MTLLLDLSRKSTKADKHNTRFVFFVVQNCRMTEMNGLRGECSFYIAEYLSRIIAWPPPETVAAVLPPTRCGWPSSTDVRPR